MAVEQMRKTRAWIFSAGLALTVLVILYFGDQYPPDETQTSGSIVPAERYQAYEPAESDFLPEKEEIARFMHTDA